MAKLAVCIPTFNRLRSLEKVVSDLLPQTDNETRIFVCDNCSDVDISHSKILQDPRIVIHRNASNIGMVRNWNQSLALSDAEWACVIHDDDRAGPQALASIREAIRIFPDAGMIVHSSGWPPPGKCRRFEYVEAGSEAVKASALCASGAVVNRKVVAALGGFDVTFKYSSDIECFARWAAKYAMVIIKSPMIVQYNLHESNCEYETWRRTDFFDQLLEIERRVAEYAGIELIEREEWVAQRMAAHLKHIIKNSVRIKDASLMRRYGTLLWRMRTSYRGVRIRALCVASAGVVFAPLLKPKRHEFAAE